EQGCKCPRAAVGWYLRKLSQPILDRIDLHVEMSAVPVAQIASVAAARDESEHAAVKALITEAHQLQRKRNSGVLNAFAPQEQIKKVSGIAKPALTLLERAAERLNLSARGYMRMLRVARTIADLNGCAIVDAPHIAEAVSFRSLERLKRYADSIS